MHVNSDDDPVETEVKGKLTISCIISELLERNYKATESHDGLRSQGGWNYYSIGIYFPRNCVSKAG